jgi:tRNA (guanine37-N1)-methyltransferase
MRFDVVTIFPAMVRECLKAGVLGRAIEGGTIGVTVHDLRDFTVDRHRVVDDVPYGGGPGMVLKAEPIFRALDAIGRSHVILTSPQCAPSTQAAARGIGADRGATA